jgi:hypothetical protein
MIDLDFGDSEDVPTLWIIVNDRKDFAPLRQLVFELLNGKRDSIDVFSYDVFSYQEMFRGSPSVQGLSLTARADVNRGEVDIKSGISGYGLIWKQPRLDWDSALQKIDAMHPGSGHQYFDYPNITIVVSVGEGLSRAAPE